MVDEQKMVGSGDQVSTPVLAADLWQNPLADAVAPDEVGDPRQPWRWFTGALLVALAAVLLVRWRRRGRQALPGAVGPPPSLRPLTMAATGLLLVLIDVNIGRIDLVPDPVGWVLAAVALSSLQPIHRGFYVAGLAAWVALGLALITASVEPNAGIVVFTVGLADLLVTVWFLVMLYAVAKDARSTAGSTAGRSLRAG